jgi:hypothetical protein
MKTIASSVLVVLAAAGAAEGQGLRPVGNPSVRVGGGVVLAQPIGAFADQVDLGYGLAGHAVWTPAPNGVFSLRLDGMFLVYGSETRRYQLLPLIDVDVTTRNQVAGLQIGPQLTVGKGVLRFYGYSQLGFSYFATTSSVEGSGNVGSFANTTNLDDVTLAASGGGGVLVRLGRGRTPVALDLGARYLHNGRVRYLREGSIAVDGNDVTISPIESQANLVVYQLGVSIGLR